MSPVEIANQFNNLSRKKICRNSEKHMSTFFKQEVLSRFDFQCVNCVEVKKVIDGLATKNSCGIDAISTKLIKMISDAIAGPLTVIIIQSLFTGIFPDKLKIAKMILLYKKDDPHPVDNFRQISLVPAISKIFEKKLSLIRCMHTLIEINGSIQANTAFANSTQRNLHHQD